MKRTTPATAAANTPQKVLKSLEPLNNITINIIETVDGKGLIQRLDGIKKFASSLDPNTKYDLLLQVDKLDTEGQCDDRNDQ